MIMVKIAEILCLIAFTLTSCAHRQNLECTEVSGNTTQIAVGKDGVLITSDSIFSVTGSTPVDQCSHTLQCEITYEGTWEIMTSKQK